MILAIGYWPFFIFSLCLLIFRIEPFVVCAPLCSGWWILVLEIKIWFGAIVLCRFFPLVFPFNHKTLDRSNQKYTESSSFSHSVSVGYSGFVVSVSHCVLLQFSCLCSFSLLLCYNRKLTSVQHFVDLMPKWKFNFIRPTSIDSCDEMLSFQISILFIFFPYDYIYFQIPTEKKETLC